MRNAIFLYLVFCAAIACNEKKEAEKKSLLPSGLPGEALAIQHCGSCHAFVQPQMLPASAWNNDVLPSMGHRLGIYKGQHQPDSLFDDGIGGQIVRRANIYPETPEIALEDWNKIVSYYTENAPDTIMPPSRDKKIAMGLSHFKYRASRFSHKPPLTIMVKILPDKRGIVFGDGKKNSSNLTYLNADLDIVNNITFPTTPVHYDEKEGTVFLTTIGKSVYPHDSPDGKIYKLTSNNRQATNNSSKQLITNMQRPVYVEYADLDGDGLEDIVVCEYGNLTGKLVWYQNKGNEQYAMRPLNGRPGAIKTIVKDFDEDGHRDVVALMAQGDEGLFWYRNRGNGTFEEIRLLTFLPLYGSQYFEFADFNKDGNDDIIYVCGDNADLTPILKNYHGIYIYLNDGSNHFSKAFFYQLNGAYKAIPRDFDLDGDLDIAAISFFPDYYSYPEESFVYLENKGSFIFNDYSFEGSTDGRWIVMDAEDMDGDGDIDLALGSFVAFIAAGDTTGLGEKWFNTGPSIAVLENTIR